MKTEHGWYSKLPTQCGEEDDVTCCYWSVGWFCPVRNFEQGNWSTAMYRGSLHSRIREREKTNKNYFM